MKEVKNHKQKEDNLINYNKAFPTLLRQLIFDNNVKQKDLSNYIGSTRQTISKYQNGESAPDIYTFNKIRKFFEEKYNINYPLNYWLGDLKIDSEDMDIVPFSIEEIGLSQKAYSSIISCHNQPEIFALNKILENFELIQLFQDYLGNEIRNSRHFAFEKTKDSLNNLFKAQETWISLKSTPESLYQELKLNSIIKEIKKMQKK